jgi:hypothetical protein
MCIGLFNTKKLADKFGVFNKTFKRGGGGGDVQK